MGLEITAISAVAYGGAAYTRIADELGLKSMEHPFAKAVHEVFKRQHDELTNTSEIKPAHMFAQARFEVTEHFGDSVSPLSGGGNSGRGGFSVA